VEKGGAFPNCAQKHVTFSPWLDIQDLLRIAFIEQDWLVGSRYNVRYSSLSVAWYFNELAHPKLVLHPCQIIHAF